MIKCFQQCQAPVSHGLAICQKECVVLKIIACLILIGFSLAPAGCNREEVPQSMTVSTSIEPTGWLIREIAGDIIEVNVLLPSSGSHHSYQPSEAEITKVMASDAYFTIGLAFESRGWIGAIERSPRVGVIDLTEGIKRLELAEHAHHEHDEEGEDHAHDDHSELDPHLWLDPQMLIKMARVTAAKLSAMYPDYTSSFQQNLIDFEQRMMALDNELKEKLEPVQRRDFFVFHPAWGYFGNRYGFKQHAIEVGGREPTDAEISDLIVTARQTSAVNLFVQPQINSATAQRVADAIGMRVVTVDPMAVPIDENLRRFANTLADTQ